MNVEPIAVPEPAPYESARYRVTFEPDRSWSVVDLASGETQTVTDRLQIASLARGMVHAQADIENGIRRADRLLASLFKTAPPGVAYWRRHAIDEPA